MMKNFPAAHERVVVVGVDGSLSSVTALQLAAQFVPAAGDVIHAVAAWHYPLAFGLYAPTGWNPQDQAEEVLDRALAIAFHDEAPCRVERLVLQGPPAEILIEKSKSASLVVVGSRGHGGFAGLLLGSVSSAIAERSACPVLISHGALQLSHDASTVTPAAESLA
ncbi:universal stress protein [Arthrobacter agilis]|uniref:universal stress protein n=1 Tax=Arthrobacter agilis TaxID=37921 RepID=UPI002782DABE|nr:universal stress protein [Arthrobacter agilis]MDQ0735077.1 nucleotide-binding universal stress UspA family protein [Arthrobacter agilis]